MAKATHIAERYARALLDVSEQRKETDGAQAALLALSHAIESNPHLGQVLIDPRMREERLGVFEAIADKAKAPSSLKTFMKVLNDSDRLSDLPALATAFSRLADDTRGRVHGTVVSAIELPAAAQKSIGDALSLAVGKQVTVKYSVDASLIGGVVAKVQDLVWDGSLRTQLRQLHQSLVSLTRR